MSDHPNALQKPIFAPVSQGNKLVDDIDLSDIFAEYFNDVGDDPLTTFSNSSICSDAAAAGHKIQQQQVQQISSVLTSLGPSQTIGTGFTLDNKNVTLSSSKGIKTPYHANLLHTDSTSSGEKHGSQDQDVPQMQQLPPEKKLKVEQVTTQNQQDISPPNTASDGPRASGINPLRIQHKVQSTGINPLGVIDKQPAQCANPLNVTDTRAPVVNPLGGTARTQALGINPLGVIGRTQGPGLNPLGVSERSQSYENPLVEAKRTQTSGINPLGVKGRTPPNPLGASEKIQGLGINPLGVTASQSEIGLSGRLGISMVDGQLSIPKTSSAGVRTAATQNSQLPVASNGISLPVGRGIRVGNIVPQTLSGVVGTVNQAGQAVSSKTRNVAMPKQIQNQYSPWMGLGGMGGASGGITEQAMAERRQRNREHAKRSRVRKKFMLESLQHEAQQLQRENNNLRMIVQGKIPQHAQKIIDECCQKSSLFYDGEDDQESGNPNKNVELVKSDFSLISSLTSGQQNFVLSDPRLLDNPIVYASEGFYQLTGYKREEVLGRNCRFLQGPGTDPKAIDVIRAAVANGTDATTCLLNYKADGTPFWNQFFVAALRDSDNCIVNYVGVQCAVDSNAGASALEDKVNSVLPLQNRGESPIHEGSK